MAYNNYSYSNNYSGSSRKGGGREQRGYGDQNRVPEPIQAEEIPEDYVDRAEDVMRRLTGEGSRITTSKIRNLYSMVTDIYNTEILQTGEKLQPDSVTALLQLRVRLAYESGRDESTKKFISEARLLQYLKGIGDSREKLLRFARYMEALVAYHRYFGGREN